MRVQAYGIFVHIRTRMFLHTCTSARRVAPGRGQHAGLPHRRNNKPTINRTLSLSVPYSLTMPSNPSTKTSRSKPSLLQMTCTRVRCTDDVGWYCWFRKVRLIRTRGSTKWYNHFTSGHRSVLKRPRWGSRFVFVWRQGQGKERRGEREEDRRVTPRVI